jgi:hypothetical protein
LAKGFELSNGRIFETQGKGLAYFSAMLARYADGEVVSDPVDHADLVSLLERYDQIFDGPSKIGSGVARFERRKTFVKGFWTFGFWVVRKGNDGDTDFSYKTAVTGRPKAGSQAFYDACHNSVVEDLRAEKARQFDRLADADGCLPCDITGEMITFKSGKLCHAFPSFGELVGTFKKNKGWTSGIPEGVLTQSTDRQISTEFIDKAIREEFRVLHHLAARLRIVQTPFASRAVVKDVEEIKRVITLGHYL